jgi:MtN3 and saliva related transmembrane protein
VLPLTAECNIWPLRRSLRVNDFSVGGFLAAGLTTSAFLPQAWLTFRTRDVSGISLGMYAVFTLGIAAWLAYGLMLGAWPVIIANGITLALAAGILAMKILMDRMP